MKTSKTCATKSRRSVKRQALPAPPKVVFYGRHSCRHCQHAKAFLQRHEVIFEEYDIILHPPSREILLRIIEKYGPGGAANPRCSSYRTWGFHQKKLSPGEALRCLTDDPNLIRRPVLVIGRHVLAGFEEDELLAVLKTALGEESIS